MILNLANKYCGDNQTALEELTELGYEIVLEFAGDNFVTNEQELECPKNRAKKLLTRELVKSNEVRLAIYSILKNRIRDYAFNMGIHSPVFTEFELKDHNPKYRTAHFGSLESSDADEDSVPGEYCPALLSDGTNIRSRDDAELWIDVARYISPDDCALLRKKIHGATIAELCSEYGISHQAVTKRLNKIREKLAPLCESLRSTS